MMCGWFPNDEMVGEVHIVAEHELWTHAKIQVHRVKTHVWWSSDMNGVTRQYNAS